MNLRRATLLALIPLLALSALPASAGTVYVSLAMDGVIRGVEYTTVLTVTNPTAEGKSFTIKFLPSDSDGTDRPEGEELPETIIPANSTRVLTDLVPAGQSGMLEITGSTSLVIRASLKRKTGGPGGEIPVIDSDNVFNAQETIYLQGLHRDTRRSSALGVVNLGSEIANCAVDLTTAQGGRLTNQIVLALKPLSQLYFRDALNTVGNQSGANIQTTVRCSQRAYAFANIIDPQGTIASIDPSASLNSNLIPPGVQLACPDGSVCLEKPGLFHTATGANTTFKADIPLDPSVNWSAVKVSLTFRHGGWFGPLESGIHNFFWIFHNDWQDTYGYMNARGGNRNVVTMLTNAGLPRGQTSRPDRKFGLSPGATYKVDYTYDTRSGTVTGIVTTLGGTEVVRLTDITRVNSIPTNGKLTIWVGNPDGRVHGASEVPSLNWDYSDLRVEVVP